MSAIADEDPYFAPSVSRAVRLLHAIADGDGAHNLSRTAKALSINRTTLLRLLHTLSSEGFLERDEAGGYRIGLGIVGIAARTVYAQDLMQVALPIVSRLSETVRLSAHLGVLDGADALYLVRRTPNLPLASTIQVGSRIPAYATTLGRAILATRPAEETIRLLADIPFDRFTGHTPASTADLLALLAEERAAGYSWSDSHYQEGIGSVGVPVFDASGHCVAGLNVTGPASQFARRTLRLEAIVREVSAAAAEASERLGHTRARPTTAPIPLRRR